MFQAAKEGNLALVKSLLKSGDDVNAVDAHGTAAICWPCFRGHTEIVKLLIKNGVNVNAVGPCKLTPLFWACAQGHADIAKLLIENGVNIDAIDVEGGTPLHLACTRGHTDTVKLLIEYGAEINAVDTDGNTPLYWAYKHGHTDTANLIIDSILLKNLEARKSNFIPDFINNKDLSNYWDKKVIEINLGLHLQNKGIDGKNVKIVLNKASSGNDILLTASAKALPFFKSHVKSVLISKDSLESTTSSIKTFNLKC